MITAAVVCPHPPLLLRELSGVQDVAADLRAACLTALGEALSSDPARVVVVGGDVTTAPVDADLPVAVRRFGTADAPQVAGLPQSLGVAKRLLEESGWDGPVEMHVVAWGASPQETHELARRLAGGDERTVLLVLGEGSTRRGDKAPGYLDERAFAFDAETGAALASGDVATLLGTDAVLAEELMVSGRAPWQVLASAVREEGATVSARSLYADDPHGVMYHVAVWRFS